MELFTKTFFRLAFGFLATILISVAVIITANTIYDGESSSGKFCITDCTAK